MQIQSYSNAQAVNPFELNPQQRRRTVQEQAQSSGDTVSFSPEALELLARMQATRQDAAQTSSSETSQNAAQDNAKSLDSFINPKKSASVENTGSSANSDGATAHGGESGDMPSEGEGAEAAEGGKAGGGKDSSSGSTSEADKIRQQIKQLSSTVQNLMKGDLPAATKVAQSQPFEAQIQVLEQRLQELEAQAKEG